MGSKADECSQTAKRDDAHFILFAVGWPDLIAEIGTKFAHLFGNFGELGRAKCGGKGESGSSGPAVANP